jgi:hypothetical protein
MATNMYLTYIQVGKDLGLSGQELHTYADERAKAEKAELREKERIDRENRALEREANAKIEQENIKLLKEQKEVEIRLLQMQKDDKEAEAKMKEAEAKMEIDRLRIKHQLEDEALEKQRNFEFQMQKMKFEMELSKPKSGNGNDDYDVEPDDRPIYTGYGKRYDLGLGKFNNVSENLDPFLNRFQLITESYQLPPKLWSVELSKSLDGIALETFDRLPLESRTDYHAVVRALRKRFNVTESTYRKLFKTSKVLENESYSEFVQRLRYYLKSWIEKSNFENTYEGLFDLMVSQAFFLSLPREVQTHIKEMGKVKFETMIEIAQNYSDAHYELKSSQQYQKKKESNDFRGKNEQKHGLKESKFFGKTNQKDGKTQNEGSVQNKAEQHSEQNKREVICYRCTKPGHKANVCTSTEVSKTWNNNKSWKKSNQDTMAFCQVEQNGSEMFDSNKEMFPTLALMTEEQTEHYLEDMKYPYIGGVVVNGTIARYLRDSGSNFTVVHERLVNPEDYTNNKITVRLADGCVRYVDEAIVKLACPYFNGKTRVLVMQNPAFDVLIGNETVRMNGNKTQTKASDNADDEKENVCSKTLIFENSFLTGKESQFKEENELTTSKMVQSIGTIEMLKEQNAKIQNRIKETCEFAQREMSKIRKKINVSLTKMPNLDSSK